MTNTLNTKLLSLTLLAVSTSSLHSFADNDSAFTISPMFGKAFFAKHRDLQDENFYSLGLGYEFNNTWATELSYLKSEPGITGSNQEIDLSMVRLDGLYHFGEGAYRPYLVAGLGETTYKFLDSFDETTANVGAGIKYSVNKVLQLRGDVRLVQGLETGESDYLAALGLNLRFGQDSQTRTPVSKAAPSTGNDSDKDGVINELDQCPTTLPGVAVDSVGCDLAKDTDQDGVVDQQDKCPNSKAGANVDDTGCYVELSKDVTVDLHVKFANNSADITSDAREEIKKVADFMRQYPTAKVVIEGHTDDRGSAQYNRQLSQKRAKAVADLLLETFAVNAANVSSIGHGESQPIADNATAEGRAANRRVVAVVRASVKVPTK
ncbi:Outer membrane porin F [Thalassocella blandensis]|nr:Outer membrane porin F [Thalassocella blandensis]